MADYSTVTLTIQLARASEEARAAAALAGLDALVARVADDAGADVREHDDGTIVIQEDDARYGSSAWDDADDDDPRAQLLDRLVDANVPFELADAGHYTWSPEWRQWDPEHGTLSGIADTDGNPVLRPTDAINAVRAALDPDAADRAVEALLALLPPYVADGLRTSADAGPAATGTA